MSTLLDSALDCCKAQDPSIWQPALQLVQCMASLQLPMMTQPADSSAAPATDASAQLPPLLLQATTALTKARLCFQDMIPFLRAGMMLLACVCGHLHGLQPC